MSRSYSTLIFDLGGVVFAWRPEELFEQVFGDASRRALDGFYRHPDWIELDRGTLDTKIAASRAASRTGLPEWSFAELLRRVPDALQPIEGTLELIERAHRAGLRLCCLSNMHTAVIDELEQRESFWSLFDGAVFSCRVKTVKPELRIYRELVETTGIDPAASLFIDDRQENLDAAARLGIAGHLFESPTRCAEALETLAGLDPRR